MRKRSCVVRDVLKLGALRGARPVSRGGSRSNTTSLPDCCSPFRGTRQRRRDCTSSMSHRGGNGTKSFSLPGKIPGSFPGSFPPYPSATVVCSHMARKASPEGETAWAARSRVGIYSFIECDNELKELVVRFSETKKKSTG